MTAEAASALQARGWRWAIAALVMLTLVFGASRILRAPAPSASGAAPTSAPNNAPTANDRLAEQDIGVWRWTQDPQAQLTPELLLPSLAQQGAGSRWQAFSDAQVLPTGGKSVAWLHLHLPAHESAQTLYLEFERARVLKIEGFYQAADGHWVREAGGFTVPFHQRALPTQHPTFAITQRSGMATDYLVRVQHLAPLVLNPRLLASPGFADSSRQNGLLDGLILGSLLAFCLLCILAMAFTRSMGFVWPLLLALGATLVFGPTLGLTARYLWPDSGSLDRTLTWAAQPILAAITAAALLSLLWRVARELRWVRLMLLASVLGCSALVAFHWFDPKAVHLAQHRAAGLAASLLMLAAAWQCLASHRAQTAPQGQSVNWIAPLVYGLAAVALISVPRLLRALGWIENSDWFELGGTFAYLMQCILMYIAMVMANNTRLVRRELVSALSPVDPQTGLNTWRHCASTVERVIQRQSAVQHSASVLGIRVANYAAVQDAAGFAAAQNAVIALGLRLRAIAQPLDSIAQMGPAILIWAIDRALSSDELTALAQLVRLANAKPYDDLSLSKRSTGNSNPKDSAQSPAQSNTSNLQLAIVCALNPPRNESADLLLDRIAAALELGGTTVQRNLQFLDSGD